MRNAFYRYPFGFVFLAAMCAAVAGCPENPPVNDDDTIVNDDDVVGDDDDGVDDDDDTGDSVGVNVDLLVNELDEGEWPNEYCCLDYDPAVLEGDLVMVPDDGAEHALTLTTGGACSDWDPGAYFHAKTMLKVVDGAVLVSVYHYWEYIDVYPQFEGEGYWTLDEDEETDVWVNVSIVDEGGTLTVSLNADVSGEWYCDATPGGEYVDTFFLDYGEMVSAFFGGTMFVFGNELLNSSYHGYFNGENAIVSDTIDSGQFVCTRL